MVRASTDARSSGRGSCLGLWEEKVGRSAVLPTPGSGVSQSWLTKLNKTKPIAGPSHIVVEPDHNMYVFVGNKAKNYKLVKFVTGRI
jgi:hypothetical protein